MAELTTYECANVSTYKNIHEGYSCKLWVEVSQSPVSTLLPPITIEQGMEISIQCCLLLVMACGIRLIGKLIN